MKSKEHRYHISLVWTGNRGTGTSSYTAYERQHILAVDGKPTIEASSDPSFRGDARCYNPEELLVASLSSCHMLWYLHLCADAGVVVLAYQDDPVGYMKETADGGGRFVKVCLKPQVHVREEATIAQAYQLHEEAHKRCFIANSVNFLVEHQAHIAVAVL